MQPCLRVASLIAVASLASACGSRAPSASQPSPPRTVTSFSVTREDVLTGDGMPNGSLAYVYSTSESTNLERIDDIGEAQTYTTFEYDALGVDVVREKHYTADDMLTLDIEYSYLSDGSLTEAVSYDGNGAMLSFETYEFSQGAKHSATLHDAADHVYSFTYDAAGKRLGSVEQDTGDVTLSSSMWQYASDGTPMTVQIFAADGTTLQSSRRLTTVPSGSNYDYWAFWDY
ncbi:MAG TPA: hypothetical protein VGM29_14355 [Polyangiaceae bacterium]|jgi:YD repeat-containing protein